jgi:hypothetical protein
MKNPETMASANLLMGYFLNISDKEISEKAIQFGYYSALF